MKPIELSFTMQEQKKKGLGKPFSGLLMNVRKRKPYYKSDWTDGFNQKSVSAILFYFSHVWRLL